MAASSSTADDKDGKRSRRIRPGKKGHVKRPMNAFMIWGRAERRRLYAENPTASNGDLSRILGHRWNAMSDDEKQPFLAEGERLRIEHRRQYPHYKFNPRPPRRRAVDTTMVHQQEFCSMAFPSLDGSSTTLAEVNESRGNSSQMMSALQQCSVSELLSALASKIARPSTNQETGARIKSEYASCSGDNPYKNSERSRQGERRDGDLAERSSSIDEEQLRMRGAKSKEADSPTKDFKQICAHRQSELGKTTCLYRLPTGCSVSTIPSSDYSHPRPFRSFSGLPGNHVKSQGDPSGQSSSVAAAGRSSTSHVSLASGSSVNRLRGYLVFVPGSRPTITTHAVIYPSADTAISSRCF